MFRSARLPKKKLFTASSSESDQAFWHLLPHHPANTSTAPPCPLHPLPLSPGKTYAHKQPHSVTNKYTHAYTGTDIDYLSYTGSKQRISKARVPCICSLFGVLFGRISALSLNKEKKKLSQKSRTPSCVLFFFFL